MCTIPAITSIGRVWACSAFLLCMFHSNGYSQFNWRQYEVGAGMGTMVYQGDLSPSVLGAYQQLKVASQVYLNKMVNDYFSVRLQYSGGRVSADESLYTKPAWRQQRGFQMQTRLHEFAVLGVWYMRGRQLQRASRQFEPYLLAGIGFTSTSVQRDYSNMQNEIAASFPNVLIGLNSDISNTPPKSVIVLPVGAGVRYWLTPRIGMSGEMQYRFTRSDMLDGFSQSGDPDKKDHYYGVNVGVVFRLGNLDAMPCPAWGRKR